MRRIDRSALSWAAAAVALVVLAAVGGGAWATSAAHPTATVAAVPTKTATVERTTLSSTTQLSGTLGHGASRPLFSPASGTVTAVPMLGSTITAGGVLFTVDGRPIVLMGGAEPAWRDFHVGMSAGADVRQLEADLVDLGFASGLGLTVDDTYTSRTATAVGRWQRSLGLPATGSVSRSDLAFEPGAVRILGLTAPLGSRVSDGEPALMVGSTSVEVTAAVPAAQTDLVHPGDRVTVTLPAGRSVAGAVTAVSTVAASDSSGAGGQQNNGPVTIPATIVLDDPSQASGLDEAPVTVQVTDRTVTGVLAVPITALVALAGGGYGVYVAHGSARDLVAVTPGVFAGTRVQVDSAALRAGDRVVVPAS